MKNEIKVLTIRIPKKDWMLLRKIATKKEASLNSLFHMMIDELRAKKIKPSIPDEL